MGVFNEQLKMSQRFYKKAGVQEAFVAGVFLLIATILTVSHYAQKGEGGTSNTVKVFGATNSPVTQINQSSNSTVNNNSGNVAFNNARDTIYQTGTNNQLFNISNTVNNLTQLAPNGVPISANGSTINGNIYVNVGNAPNINTQVESEITQLRSDLENEGKVTKQDILTLTRLVGDLDKRTEDIHRLPDGRTSLGGNVAFGFPKYAENEYVIAISDYNKGDYLSAFSHFTKTIEDFESDPTNWVQGFEIISIRPEWKSDVYKMASVTALKIGSNNIFSKYAQNAVNLNSIPQTESLLIASLVYNGTLAFQRNDISNSFVFFSDAVKNYENYSKNTTNLISEELLVPMYWEYGALASVLGKTNEASKANQKIAEIRKK